MSGEVIHVKRNGGGGGNTARNKTEPKYTLGHDRHLAHWYLQETGKKLAKYL